MTGQMSIFDYMVEDDPIEAEPIQTKPKPVITDPGDFSQYIGKCEFCMWYCYGLRTQFKTEEPTEGRHCQWEAKKTGAFRCKNRDMWKPGEYSIPGLCSNCAHSNCFCYQKKPEYTERDRRAFSDPVEEPNIYCTREGGSVNRREVFRKFWENKFGACKWDRQHEWDTCDAWRSDGWKLERRNNG